MPSHPIGDSADGPGPERPAPAAGQLPGQTELDLRVAAGRRLPRKRRPRAVPPETVPLDLGPIARRPRPPRGPVWPPFVVVVVVVKETVARARRTPKKGMSR